MGCLETKGNKFFINDEQIAIHSGAIHYFRTLPEDWEDRLYKLKACGFNTVETYVAWNLHEPREGKFDFSGICDIERFVKTAEILGLYVILRPGPYICAEWEFGGLPFWLGKYNDMKLRCNNPLFLSKVFAFFDELIPRMLPFLSTNGGPIIAMQIENEYGSFGSDKSYLRAIRSYLEKGGVDSFFFTSDGAIDGMLTSGALDGALATANFGSNPEKNFEVMQRRFPNVPMVCMEYWNGWFDHWGGGHVTRPAQSVVDDVKYMVEHGMSFNMYMFHGGTNFGFMNGANFMDDTGYAPTVTSYDYGALLTESGEPTEKYWKVKEILNPAGELKTQNKAQCFGDFKFSKHAFLFDELDNLSNIVESPVPLTFEELDTDYGFVLYRHTMQGPREEQTLFLRGLCDRAQIFADKKAVATYYRNDKASERIKFKLADEQIQLDILVENMGRINYGPYLGEGKGITKGVWQGSSYGNFAHGFTHYALPLNNLEKLNLKKGVPNADTPVFFCADFEIETPADTFVCLNGLTKGVVFINGFNLGRYWSIGPQRTLYLPASLLKAGKNTMLVFEQHRAENASFSLVENHILDAEIVQQTY